MLNNKWPWAMLVVVLLPFFMLLFFTYPASDDYSFFANTRQYSFVGFMQWGYTHLSGRYAAILITKLFNPLYSNGFWLYRFMALLIMACFTHSLYVFFNALFKSMSIGKGLPGVVLTMVSFVWLFMPNIAELVYWYSSAYSYTIGLIGLLYWWGLWLGKIEQLWQRMALALLPVFIAGTCELAAELMVITWVVVLIYHFINRQKLDNTRLLALGVSIVVILIALLAPGNTARHTGISYLFSNIQPHDATFAIQQTLTKWWAILARQFVFAVFMVPVVLVLIILSPAYQPATSLVRLAWLLLPFTFFTIPALLFPYYWATGMEFIPLRLVNYTFVVFVITAMPVFYLIALPVVNIWLNNRLAHWGIIGLVLIGVSLRSNIRYAVTDLTHILGYQKQMEARYNELESSPGKTVVFSKLEYSPKTILHADVDTAAGHWYNRGLAQYYGVKSIRRKP